jgi:hypothetical protein
MGTKNNPGKFDCYEAALPDEPMFMLLARDPQFYQRVMDWANQRDNDVRCGERPPEDMSLVREARTCAFDGQQWRRENNGIWRKS